MATAPTTALPRTATLEEVARRARLSRQTISNALNAPDRLHPHTLQRALHAVDELGYRPNRAARSLRTRTSQLIGYRAEAATEPLSGGVLDRFLHALSGSAQRRGYHVLLFTPDLGAETAAYEAMLRAKAVDAFVLTATHREDPRPAWLSSRQVPYVAFGRLWRTPESGSWVDVDGASGTAAAVDHLVERGHRRVAFVGWPAGSPVGDDRLAGWRRSARRHGLATAGLSARAADGVSTGARLTDDLLARADPPTAFVCASDALAIGCLHRLGELGRRPGRDVGVVGFDDSAPAALVRPALSSLRQPLDRVADEVVRLLADRLTGMASGPERALLAPDLIIRDSS